MQTITASARNIPDTKAALARMGRMPSSWTVTGEWPVAKAFGSAVASSSFDGDSAVEGLTITGADLVLSATAAGDADARHLIERALQVSRCSAPFGKASRSPYASAEDLCAAR